MLDMGQGSGVDGAGPYNSIIVKHVKKSVLLWYSAHEMYDLVTGVEDYPRFLPWCERAELFDENEDSVTARLGLAYMGVRHSFTTRNQHVPGESVLVKLVDGPFSLLDGTWFFRPLGRPGDGQTQQAVLSQALSLLDRATANGTVQRFHG